MVGIIWAFILCFIAIRVAAIVSVTILIEDGFATIEQAEELYKNFVRLEYLKRKDEDEDRWGRKR